MTDRVMLLIDADNVSVDVIEQAVRLILKQHGGLHVRRAYCTAESAVKNQAAFKRLGIKPMVNLAAGKNSTDIALAVDAIDLVLAERPDVVVIASSDSDFAPLVQRLREKGCEVRGIGQMGKTGDETQDVYDDFTVLEHRKADAAMPTAKAARTRAPAAKKVATAKTPAVKKAPAKKAAASDAPARKPRVAKAAASAVVADQVLAVVAPPPPSPPPPAPAPAPEGKTRESGASSGRGGRSAVSIQAVLGCLPELSAGQGLALNVAVQRLREAQLLGRNNSSLKLFAQFGDRFELLPTGKPSQVRLRG
jgi:uncharacterized protein (TIGR00288 family)